MQVCRIIVFGVFFWFRGPKLCPNRTGNTKFYKNLTRVRAYTRFPLSHACPGTSRNKGNFSEKIYSTISTDRLEQNSEDVGFFHAPTYTVDAWKNPKIESCYTIFGCGNGAILVILFKKIDFFVKKKNKKMQKKIKKTFFFLPTSHYHLTLRSVRKNISKNFPNQFYTRISKFEPIFKFCLGQR